MRLRRERERMLRRASLRFTVAAARRSSEGTPSLAHGERFLSRDPRFLIPVRHFLDTYKMGRSKEAIEKERARLNDELSRGYFADISEMRKNGGKIAMANKVITPSIAAAKFPDLEVNFSDGKNLKLPTSTGENAADTNEMAVPSASLLCISFRANSQKMVESWSVPFLDAFSSSGEVQVYEVSLIDNWLLSLGGLRRLLLKAMKKSDSPQKNIVYSFGDHYDFRKKLQILNLLTAYIFLLDSSGRIRWQGFGFATQDEVSFLLSCTSTLLEEK